jgi:hypothetical protein
VHGHWINVQRLCHQEDPQSWVINFASQTGVCFPYITQGLVNNSHRVVYVGTLGLSGVNMAVNVDLGGMPPFDCKGDAT